MRMLLFALVLLHGGLAAADDEDAEPAAGSDEGRAQVSSVHHEGDYGGVSPDHPANTADGKSTHKAKARRAGRGVLVTWVGFQVRDGGGARVFVQLDTETAYEQRVVEDTLVVFLAGARLGKRNNGRFIDTSFFDTSVQRVEARSLRARRGQKAGVELTVHFKKGAAKNAEARAETSTDGHRYLFLDFAP
jgi:hypothetical protein